MYEKYCLFDKYLLYTQYRSLFGGRGKEGSILSGIPVNMCRAMVMIHNVCFITPVSRCHFVSAKEVFICDIWLPSTPIVIMRRFYFEHREKVYPLINSWWTWGFYLFFFNAVFKLIHISRRVLDTTSGQTVSQHWIWENYAHQKHIFFCNVSFAFQSD